MTHFLVSGIINIETTMQVDEFPVPYTPVEYPFFTIDATVSGVGFNITKALTRLGNKATLLSLIGRDFAVASVRAEFAAYYIDDSYVLETVAQTARSVIIYDQDGRSKIVVDLKNYQKQIYSIAHFEKVLPHCDMAVLCNINFTRPLLALSKQAGKSIASDVHIVEDLDDEYNHDYMAAADILFMSDELLPEPPEIFAKEVLKKYQPKVLVIAMGAQGALLAYPQEDFIGIFPTVYTRPIVNTIGAGDALFSAFIHSYMQTQDPYEAIKKALVFASYKIGVRSASDGFIGNRRLAEWYEKVGEE